VFLYPCPFTLSWSLCRIPLLARSSHVRVCLPTRHAQRHFLRHNPDKPVLSIERDTIRIMSFTQDPLRGIAKEA
jgi:hypothetical protein